MNAARHFQNTSSEAQILFARISKRGTVEDMESNSYNFMAIPWDQPVRQKVAFTAQRLFTRKRLLVNDSISLVKLLPSS